MQQRNAGRRIIIATAGVLAALAPAGRARACGGEATGMLAAAAVGVLAPSEIGATASAGEASASRLVIGWSWQVPISASAIGDHASRHRVVGGVDLLPHPGGASWRGRLGYRYGRRHVFAGAGVGADGAGPNLSPEVGLKFLHGGDGGSDDMDVSLHLLARAEIEPESGHFRGGTVLLGWNLF